MFVEGMINAARDALVTITGNAKLIEAAKLLISGIDLVVVCDDDGTFRASSPRLM